MPSFPKMPSHTKPNS